MRCAAQRAAIARVSRDSAVEHAESNAARPILMPQTSLEDAKSLFLAGDHHRAEAACRALLADRPDLADALNLLALALAAQGRGAEAIAPLQQAMSIAPRRAAFAANLATVFLNLGRREDAMAAADRATALEPEVAGFQVNRSAVLLALERGEEALSAATRAAELNPVLAEAHANRAGSLLLLGRAAEALEASERALNLLPGLADGHRLRTCSLNSLGRYPEALAASRRWLAVRPDDLAALSNQAAALFNLARDEESIGVLHHALAIRPDFPDAAMNLAVACLAVGRYEEGWRHYERRLDTLAGAADRKLMNVDGPRWDGGNPAGVRLLLHREQGIGDFLQYSRYVPLLQKRGAKVLLRAHRQLCVLLRESFPGVPVYAFRDRLGDYDAWAPLPSLPLLLPETMADPPRNVPYLRATAERRGTWRCRLDSGTALKVGIAWAGSTAYYNDRYRSMNLADLAPLAAVPGIDFYSLQHGPRAEQAMDEPPFDIVHFGAQIEPVEEMAALICELDLVISVDSMAAHLAGGLGVPCWLLLPLNNDWRWLRGRDDSLWYPSTWLFRQRVLGDWSVPLHDMALALRAAASGDRSRLTRLCR
jgi:tetratricopeptide (TPR) repeat protein